MQWHAMKTIQASQILAETIENKLAEELERLKRRLELGTELAVKWLPGEKDEVCGEVKGNCIFVYSEDEDEALQTLRHELLDYATSQVIKPYQMVANKLVELVNEEAYKQKERLVEVLSQLL